MPVLSPESVLVRNERLAWRALEGEAVILFPEVGTLHRLNPTGTRVWEQLDGSCSLATIAERLSGEFRVKPDEALHDLEALVSELLDAGLVDLTESPS